MRICLIARNRFHTDRKAVATYRALERARHEVSVVAVDNSPPREPVVTTVPRRVVPSFPILGRLDSLVPSRWKNRLVTRRLLTAACATGSAVFVPLHGDVLDVAEKAAMRTGGVVQRTPDMPAAGAVDLISLAPSHPDLAQPVAGRGNSFTPEVQTPASRPAPNRLAGRRAVICYRKTEANPGRYLETALTRSGMDVRVETDSIDLTNVHPETDFVMFVEGPYPAIEVSGATSVPTLFWVHHGEHHLKANLRLTDRYQADAVLLAHSWHLAHWFPARVHRFPFAVPPELFGPSAPLRDRSYDVAMVGSKLRGESWQYRRRREIVKQLESNLAHDQVRFVEGVSPEKMAAIYANSRIVVNEGGVRHYPITMRVFEAIGAGAVLLTDPIPGLDLLFDPDEHFATLSDDVTSDVRALLDEPGNAQTMTDSATAHAQGHHTYDHRVDLLTDIARTTTKRRVPAPPRRDVLASLIADDVEVQRIVHDEVAGLAEQLPDREVWSLSDRQGRLAPASMDAAVIASDTVSGLEPLLESARRYIYADQDVAGLDSYLEDHHPDAVIARRGRFIRIDLMTEAYRVMTDKGGL